MDLFKIKTPVTTKLTFHGGTGIVTGSNFLLEGEQEKIMIDCGFFQGCNVCDVRNLSPFPYAPDSIDYIFITHAHLDHTGRLPKLVRDGFRGKIISTPPTKEIAELMFGDSLNVLREEAKEGHYAPIYDEKDIEKTIGLWETVPYHEEIKLKEFKVVFKDAGHILGSAMVEVKRLHGGEDAPRIVFTGDLGNSGAPLLRDTEALERVTYLVMESVYGDKNHEDKSERKEKLEDVIEEVIKKNGVLLIPAFSVERTQEILYEIERMTKEKKIPALPVFLDSPLAIKITEVYKKYGIYFNTEVEKQLAEGEDLFSFKQLILSETKEDSKKIFDHPNPKVIIAGSGMSSGGRIRFHEKKYLSHPETIILFVGYQVPGSLGREIQDGAKNVKIFNEKITVRASSRTIGGYSSHKDMDELFAFVTHTIDTLKNVFVVMGEPRASSFLTQRFRDYLGINAKVPQEGETVELDL